MIIKTSNPQPNITLTMYGVFGSPIGDNDTVDPNVKYGLGFLIEAAVDGVATETWLCNFGMLALQFVAYSPQGETNGTKKSTT